MIRARGNTKRGGINMSNVKMPRVKQDLQTEAAVNNTVTEEFVKKETSKKNPKGVIFNCNLLNVRETPSTTGVVKCTIEKGTKVTIDEPKSTDTFYCITTETGITGFCMRQFIKVY
jgi:uncharacterized protein YgiM (DUF1202 family)